MILVVLEFLGLMMSWLQGRGEISNEIPNGPTCWSGKTVEIFMIFTYFGAPDKIVLNAHEKCYQIKLVFFKEEQISVALGVVSIDSR